MTKKQSEISHRETPASKKPAFTSTRILFYGVGVFILALGITLNTKTGLGVSPLISIPYTVSEIADWNTGNITLIFYSFITVLQLIIRGKNRRWLDLLQIPFSIVFTRFMNLFSALFDFHPQNIGQQLVILFFAIVCTGIGVCMSVNMKIIPNPCDGFVNMAGEMSGKGMGFAKNIFDITNVVVAFFIGLAAGNCLTGIGLGTIVTMLALGRVVAAFNKAFKEKMNRAAGLKTT